MKLIIQTGLITILVIIVSTISLSAQTNETPGTWHGFKKTGFQIDNTPAYIVTPDNPLPGNPWLWRSYSPEFHVAIDSILVTRGFHLAFLNYKELFGQPKLMQLWDNFYDYLVREKHFSPKPALEGAVRGSLCEFAWAKQNPDKISCIYAENPVADIKSWPAGKGKGSGGPQQWKQLLEVYGFTEEQALNYTDNPKDNLEGLAAFKVPLYFSFGLHDALVPMEENGLVLATNYSKLGGPVTVYPMTRGLQEEKGHHVTIENPAEIADFIHRSSYPVRLSLRNNLFIHKNGSLNNVLYKIKVEKQVTIAFLGGSITANPGWRDKVCRYLTEMFPETKFTFIPAGIPSLGSLPHAFRMEKDVLSKGKIDLLFLESAVNDQANSTPAIIQRRALEGIIRHAYRQNPNVNIIMMAFADESKLGDYKEGRTPAEVKLHASLASTYKLPFIDLAEEVSKRIAAGEFTWEYDFKNLHPSPFGQEIYFQSIKRLLRSEFIGKPAMVQAAFPLPPALEKANYEKGKYLTIEGAVNNKDFYIDSAWKPADKTGTRTGFVNVPMLVSEKAGASFSLTFKGTAIGIALIAGLDAGMINYSIDNKPPKTIDLFTQWSASLHLPWYLLLGDELAPGKHQLHVTIATDHNANSKGNACRIVYFLLNE
ncbi:MAG: GDSL-type esterase/lipase family protein [Chitinophagaceae bacterium]